MRVQFLLIIELSYFVLDFFISAVKKQPNNKANKYLHEFNQQSVARDSCPVIINKITFDFETVGSE